MNANENIQVLDTSELASFHYSNPKGIVVVMPCVDVEKGRDTARILFRRAGMPCKILIVHDSRRQGFIKTLNETALKLSVRYIVYLAQDAYPARDWLVCAYESMEKSGKGLLAFNDGKWKGHIASFGMVRTKWVKSLYGGKIFYSDYKSHGADNELTVIARAQDKLVYNPDCTLMEHDLNKDFGGSNPRDRALFETRFIQGFDGMVPMEKLKKLSKEYRVDLTSSNNKPGISIIIFVRNNENHLDGLLSTFLRINTYQPVEFIVIDHVSSAHTQNIVHKYSANSVIHYIKAPEIKSFAKANNLGAKMSNYSYLLFLSDDIVYTNDVLPLAAAQLQDKSIGVVGIRLDDHPPSLPSGRIPCVQHTGIKFVLDSSHEYYRPFSLRLKNIDQAQKVPSGIYPAVVGDFQLCRKKDFENLGGFCTEYDQEFEDIDFCLQIRSKLNKRCLCINDFSLEHVNGDPQHKASCFAGPIQVRNLQLLNKRAGGQLKKFATERFGSQTIFPIAQEHAPVIKQTFSDSDQISRSGVSIVILNRNGAQHLELLLETFSQTNTYQPVELIIIDHGSTDNTVDVVSGYDNKSSIRLINRGSNHSFASSCNLGANNSSYPCLLFLNNDIIYSSDVLPSAMAWLADPTIGVIGIRLDDAPDYLPPGKEPGVQHTGIAFEWDTEKKFYRPIQIRHKGLAKAREVKNGFYPAVTGAFLLCRKADFEKLGGFCEEYDYGFEDIDFCLRIGLELKKQCLCINDMSLQHVEGAARKQVPTKVKKARRQNNDALFKRRMGEHVKRLMSADSVPAYQSIIRSHSSTGSFSQVTVAAPFSGSRAASLNLLFVLYQSIDSNGGLHAQLHAARLLAQGVDCQFAVPRTHAQSQVNKSIASRVRTFAHIEDNGLEFANGRGPDIIHAWTPREVVRIFCEKLLSKHPCSLVIHLEDNEEYLTEVTVGRPFAELARLPEKELDTLIPAMRYHPIKGRNFLTKAQGLTLIIDTLNRFNYANVPSFVLPPPVDESLFYPRPLNMKLRKELGIPKGHVVLVYTGNVHAGNREEVRELYRAVSLLNEQNCPTVLIRTGINAVDLGKEAWITAYEKNLGWVERFKVPDILAAANILVQPGIPGPFNDQRIPSKLPEYFAMGRPVILPKTNIGSKVKHCLYGYVLDKADCKNIARAVLEIGKDKEMAGSLANKSFDFYMRELASGTAKVQLNNYYRQIASFESKDMSNSRLTVPMSKKKSDVDLSTLAAEQKTSLTMQIVPSQQCMHSSWGKRNKGHGFPDVHSSRASLHKVERKIKIAHIINIVNVTEESDLYIAQPITFETMRIAKEFAKTNNDVDVELYYTCYEEDLSIAPKGFKQGKLLEKSILDYKTFKNKRKLPLIKDIIDRLYESSDADYFIYTNVDIALMPHFYVSVKSIIDSGYDGFVINRRTINKKYTSVTEIFQMYSEIGEKHPGYDCFVFKREVYPKYQLGDACIGANWIGRVIISNVIAYANRFKVFEDERLTFHIGDDRSWKVDSFNDYDKNNENILVELLKTFINTNCISDKPLLKVFINQHKVNCKNKEEQLKVSQHTIQHKFSESAKKICQYPYSEIWNKNTVLRQDPVFVVGYPRSGTTLLQALLATQDNIISLPETHFFNWVRSNLKVQNNRIPLSEIDHIVDAIRQRIRFSINAVEHIKYLAKEDCLSPKMLFEIIVIDNLLDRVGSLKELEQKRWIEKTPDHTLHLDTILRFYSKVKIIYIMRNPEQAIVSRREKFQNESAWDIKKHVEAWKISVEAIEKFQKKYGEFVKIIKLEDLARDKDSIVKDLCVFLGIKFDKGKLLNYNKIANEIIMPWEHWKKDVQKYKISTKIAINDKKLNDEELFELLKCAKGKLKKYGYMNHRYSNVLNDICNIDNNNSKYICKEKDSYPIVSIITITFNAEAYLEKTIKSVISQDYPNIEYIVVDALSTDNTLNIIKKYGKKIKRFVSEKDDGIYDAMNKGVSLASGQWVNFMNAGDTFVDNQIISRIFQGHSMDADLIYGDTYFIDENGNRSLVKTKPISDLWRALNFNHNSLFCKIDLLKKFKFDLHYKIVADSKFVIECYINGKAFHYIGFPVNEYMVGGFSDQHSILRIIERWKLVSDFHLQEQKKIDDYYFRRLKNENYFFDKYVKQDKDIVNRCIANDSIDHKFISSKYLKQKMLFIGHIYHKKTLSSLFFINLLKKHFIVNIIWYDPSYLDDIFYENIECDYVIFWQFMDLHEKILYKIKSNNITLIPMYDGMGAYSHRGKIEIVTWEKFRNYKFINFSKYVDNQLKRLCFETIYVQYAHVLTQKNSHHNTKRKKVFKVFFWQRRDEITWNTLKQLLHPFQIESIHIHRAVDPKIEFVKPTDEEIKKYNITFSDWFEIKNDYLQKIQECDIYIAPRLYEGIGMSFIEAMSLGKCVIAPDSSTMNEYITHQYSGLLYDIDNPKVLDLSNAMEIGKTAYEVINKIYKIWKNNGEHKIINFILNGTTKNKQKSKQNNQTLLKLKDEFQTTEPKNKDKLLIVFPHNPFLLENGVQSRFYGLLKYFHKKRIKVDLLSHNNFVDKWEDKHLNHKLINNVYLNDFQKAKLKHNQNHSVLQNFAFNSLKIQLEKLIQKNKYSSVLVGYVHWAEIVRDIPNVKKYITIEDFISINNYERNNGNYNLGQSINEEIERIKLFDKAICISKDEKDFFERVCNNVEFHHIPHFLEEGEGGQVNKDTDIVFVGSDNPFNKDGMVWFMDKVIPFLGDKYKIKIIGGVNKHLQAYKNRFKNVQFIKYVKDLDSIYHKSKISICPLQGGTGLKIKVAESLSFGIPVVTTKYGIVGMDSKYNGCIIKNEPDDFAKAVEMILNNKTIYGKYTEEAKKYFEEHFSKENVYKKLDKVFNCCNSQ